MLIQTESDMLPYKGIRHASYQEISLFLLDIRSCSLDCSDIFRQPGIQGGTPDRVKLLSRCCKGHTEQDGSHEDESLHFSKVQLPVEQTVIYHPHA